jgi:cytochrome c-type biogenesis protein CcmH/NrfG
LSTHLERSPTDLDALVLLGETLARLGRDEDARVASLRVLRHDPTHGAALWLDGVLLAKQSRVRDAVERWRRIAEYNADDALASKAQRAIDESGLSISHALLTRIAS